MTTTTYWSHPSHYHLVSTYNSVIHPRSICYHFNTAASTPHSEIGWQSLQSIVTLWNRLHSPTTDESRAQQIADDLAYAQSLASSDVNVAWQIENDGILAEAYQVFGEEVLLPGSGFYTEEDFMMSGALPAPNA